MKAKTFFVMILIGMFMNAFGNVRADDGSENIRWPGSRSYANSLERLRISPDEAFRMLVAKTKDHPDRFIDRNPLFIAGDCYFFSEPLKTAISLQGFYVNGNTGEIEYRKSRVTIKSKQKRLPEEAYSEVTRIK